MRAWNDRDRPAVDGLLGRSDPRPVERCEFPFREESVPGGEPDQLIASATPGKKGVPLGTVTLGAGEAGLRTPDEGPDAVHGFPDTLRSSGRGNGRRREGDALARCSAGQYLPIPQ